MNALKKWGIEIENTPHQMKTSVLSTPQLTYEDGSKGNCDQYTLSKLPIQKAVHLKKENWILAYDSRSYDDANKVYGTMENAARALNINVQEPYWIELEKDSSFK